MKKLILILMPLAIILAFYGLYLSKDLSFSVIAKGLGEINITQLDYQSAQKAFDALNFTQYFEEVDGLFEYISAIFNMLWGFITSFVYIFQFGFEFTRFAFTNIFEFVRFLFTYLFS